MTCPWSQFLANPNYSYCEAQLCSWVVEPSNTWSNIGYLVVAILLLRESKLNSNRYWFSASAFVLFVGSTLFHMSSTYWARIVDVGAMLILSSLMLSLTAVKFLKWPRWVLYLLVPLISLVSFPSIELGKGSIVFIIQVFAAALVEMAMFKEKKIATEQKRWIQRALIIFIFALALNIADMKHLFCNPDNHLLTFHAVWHLLCAYCIYLGSKFYSYQASS